MYIIHTFMLIYASVECACRARHRAILQNDSFCGHTLQKKKKKRKKKKKKKKKKKSEFGHAMCPNSDTTMFGNKLPSYSITMQISYACSLCACAGMQAVRWQFTIWLAKSHMLLPKYRSGNPLSSNFHDFFEVVTWKVMFHLTIVTCYQCFGKFYRFWWNLWEMLSRCYRDDLWIFVIDIHVQYMGLYGVPYLVKTKHGKRSQNCVIGCYRLNKVS